MRKFLILLSFFPIFSHAQDLLSPEFAAKMALATTMVDATSFPQDGKYLCEYEFPPANVVGNQDSFTAFAETMGLARYTTILLCMKNQCETIGQQMERSLMDLRSVESDALKEILQAHGVQVSEKDPAIDKIKTGELSGLRKFNCANGSQFLKEVAITPCVTTPQRCRRN